MVLQRALRNSKAHFQIFPFVSTNSTDAVNVLKFPNLAQLKQHYLEVKKLSGTKMNNVVVIKLLNICKVLF